MITNFQANNRIPASDMDSWPDYEVRKSPKPPRSPNLLAACYKELEKKGLDFFDSYKIVTNKTLTPQSPLTSCRNLSSQTRYHSSELTTVEVHECYLEPKPDTSHTYVNVGRAQVDFHHNEKDDSEANDNFHAIISDHSESKGDKREAQSYNGQPESPSIPPVHEVSHPIQYEDAESVWEVYIL